MRRQLHTDRQCFHCGKAINGRADKKFCDGSCRHGYFNAHNSVKGYSPFVQRISTLLVKNRRIMAELLIDTEAVKTTKNKLTRLGFDFKYHTNVHTTPQGRTYHYCFDFGYLPLENDWYLIVKHQWEGVLH
jgi:hypothetical protein